MRSAVIRVYLRQCSKEEQGMQEVELLKGKDNSDCRSVRSRKSSIIKFYAAGSQMETGGISRKIERENIRQDIRSCSPSMKNSYIMDTPGFSSLYVNDYEKEELKYLFPEFHMKECASLTAVIMYKSRAVP